MTQNQNSLPWRVAKPNQILGDGDELLVTGLNNTAGGRWYAVVAVACGEDFFDLVDHNGDDTELAWEDITHWCYVQEIPAP